MIRLQRLPARHPVSIRERFFSSGRLEIRKEEAKIESTEGSSVRASASFLGYSYCEQRQNLYRVWILARVIIMVSPGIRHMGAVAAFRILDMNRLPTRQDNQIYGKWRLLRASIGSSRKLED